MEVRNRFVNRLQDIDEEEPDTIANRAREVLITAADKHLRRKKGKGSIGYLTKHWKREKTEEI